MEKCTSNYWDWCMNLTELTIQMKATEQYFPVVLFIMLYKVILTFESVDEILKCDHSNESYRAVLSCGTVYYAVQGNSNFWVCGWNPKVWPFRWTLLGSISCGTVYYTEIFLPSSNFSDDLHSTGINSTRFSWGISGCFPRTVVAPCRRLSGVT